MHRPLCILHANCQGEELSALLNASRAFSAEWRLRHYTNYTREPIPDEALAECGLFLYQQLGAQWGELASASLISRLPASAATLCVPNMMFRGYWPFWNDPPPIVFGDKLLDRFIDEGADKSVILRLYLHGDLGKYVDLDEALTHTLKVEERRESAAFMQVTDIITERWRDEPLFLTANHPGFRLLKAVAGGILRHLGLPPLGAEEIAGLESFPSYADFELPIHPQVAEHHRLSFIGPKHQYLVYGRRMTYEQYISRYIDCRMNKMDEDFMGYLQAV